MDNLIIIEKKKKPEGKPNRGVLILALGHPYYGCYALNLALSIKFSDPHLPVAIAYDDVGIRHLDQQRRSLVDIFLKVDESYCVTGEGFKNYIRPKLWLDKISPFEETLFLDADVLWLPHKNASHLLDQLSISPLAIGNKGWQRPSEAQDSFLQWAKPSDIALAYPDHAQGKLYNLFSELIYFKKGELAASIFEKARAFADNPGVTYKRFAGGLPDELAFELALLTTGTEIIPSPLCPFYWEVFEKKNLEARVMYEQYYAYSMGGAFLSDSVIKFYDSLVKFYTNHFKLGYHFPARKKSSFLPERAQI